VIGLAQPVIDAQNGKDSDNAATGCRLPAGRFSAEWIVQCATDVRRLDSGKGPARVANTFIQPSEITASL
jgi:hypothetical protein